MKEIIKKIRMHLETINNKKFINNLIIILLVSIISLIVMNVFSDNKSLEKGEITSGNDLNYSVNVGDDYGVYLERKLVKILSELKGVGKVSVMITLESSVEKVAANNTVKTTEDTMEEDSDGGKREVKREEISTEHVTKGNNEGLLVLKETNPSVQGVIVVAEGAEDPKVKESLYEAVKTVLNIKSNKVQIFSNKGE